jgi:hypothetical protein
MRALESERVRANEAERRAKAAETELKTLRTAQTTAAAVGMTELQQAQARTAAAEQANAELTTRLQEQGVRSAAIAAATKLGYRDPDIAYRLLDRAALEFDTEGAPKNVDKLLRELLQQTPYLAKADGQPDFGGGNRGTTPPGGATMNDLIRAAARG